MINFYGRHKKFHVSTSQALWTVVLMSHYKNRRQTWIVPQTNEYNNTGFWI